MHYGGIVIVNVRPRLQLRGGMKGGKSMYSICWPLLNENDVDADVGVKMSHWTITIKLERWHQNSLEIILTQRRINLVILIRHAHQEFSINPEV